ncbi:ATP-binding protein [Priestia megaterium]|uniref:ATP-binding protein n=1 Tax=Priestia megaterium TaxID=1404 RepID=UPI0020769A08|nr:ATP-binding protein [Priestia megaterium]USD14100.1 ATP-binding protein [Priestia megaterium]
MENEVTAEKGNMIEEYQALIKAQNLFESLRYAEYSFDSGIGEIVDNGVEAKSSKIWIDIETESKKFGTKKKAINVIKQVAITDDGTGMEEDRLSKCLVLGETNRPVPVGGKQGIGKFGVGLTLGGISVARRIEVYTRTNKNSPFLYTYIDLNEIRDGEQLLIPQPIEKEPPAKYAEHLSDLSGTIVILKDCDRLQYDMIKEQGIEASQHIAGLTTFIGRTYRKYIFSGVEFFLNDTKVYLHDPLYLLGPTIFDTKDGVDQKAELKGEESIFLPIPNSKNDETAEIKIKMSLLPKEWRKDQGAGGSDFAKKRKIPDNEGISILRADREVLYAKVPYLFGLRGQASYEFRDRFWGCEISFPAELDEYFHVRYIKRGAEPVPSLRDKIRQVIGPVIEGLRKEITNNWNSVKAEKAKKTGDFGKAEDVMAKAAATLPRSKKNAGMSEEEAEKKIDNIVKETLVTGGNPEETQKAREAKKEEIKQKPYKIEPVSYPQNIFFETEHILGKIIVKLNINHPFYEKIFVPLCGELQGDGNDEVVQQSLDKQRNRDAFMLLLLSFGKAESMFDDADMLFTNLRSQWGTILATAINQLEK